MSNFEITKDILNSFTGTFLAIISAGIVWFLKSAYEKHKAEVVALARFERIHALNLRILIDNFEFVKDWIKSLKLNNPYSFQFEDFILEEELIYKISNLVLINKILPLNYKLKRTSMDLNNIYKNYWDIIFKIDAIQNPEEKKAGLQRYHANVISVLQKVQGNYPSLKEDLIEAVATIRVCANIRFHSLFGYISIFFKDIFPKINKKSIKIKIEDLKKEITNKNLENN